MPPKNILITGASGNIGCKLRAHFSGLGCPLTLLDKAGDAPVRTADLSEYSEDWAKSFNGIDVVIHLAANGNPWAGRNSIYRNNRLVAENVFRAAQRHKVKRVIFASSNWVMAGYLTSAELITTDLPPKPVNHYGLSKLDGERLGRSYADDGMSFIAFRIGWCQPGANRPGAHMGTRWEQLKWLSDRDMCQGFERAVMAEGIDYAVLNLMSDNPGMRWDLEATASAIGYKPQDGAAAILTPYIQLLEYLEWMRYAVSKFYLF